MVVNIVGNASFRLATEGLSINTKESGAIVSATEVRLVPPKATYLRFATSGVEVFNSYKEDGCTVIAHGRQWHTRDLFIGGYEAYCVLRSVDAEGNKFYGVYDWDGR